MLTDEVEGGTRPVETGRLGEGKGLVGWARFRWARNAVAIWLMGHAGLRLGELLGLMVGDVMYGGEPVACLLVRPEIAKCHLERTIPLDEVTRGAIRRMEFPQIANGRLVMDAPLLTRSFAGERMSSRGVQAMVARLGFLAVQRLITPHMLRHTYAARLRRRCDLPVVQAMLGHACLSSTQVYMGVTGDDMRDAVKSLSGNGVGRPG